MHKFKWVIPNILAGGHHPLLNKDFNLIDIPDWYTKRGINCIISVFEAPISKSIINNVSWDYIFQPTNDGLPPKNLHNLCESISQHNGTFVHCFAGTGRTATVLAAYLLFNKYIKNAKNAILWLRKNYHKGALHTPEQYIELLEFNRENKNRSQLINDLNELFKTKHNYYTDISKYEKLLYLAKEEMKLIKEKFGPQSIEFYKSIDHYNKLERILKLLK